MERKHVLLASLILLISQLGFFLYNMWYSQNRYVTRNQQNSYIRYLYSTDINLDDLKNRLENIKHINETVYENILQLAFKHSTKELLLVLSVGEGIEFMPEKDQQMMLKIIMSRIKHLQEANLTLNGKAEDTSVSTKSFSVRNFALSGITNSETINKIQKTGNEKPKNNKQEKNNLPGKPKAGTPFPGKMNEENNNPLEKPKSGTSSPAKDGKLGKNNPPKNPKARTPSPKKVNNSNLGKILPPEKLKTGGPSLKKINDKKQEKSNPREKPTPGTSSPAKDGKLGKNNPPKNPKARAPSPKKLNNSNLGKVLPPEKLKTGWPSLKKINDTKLEQNNPREKPKTRAITQERVTNTQLGKQYPPKKAKVGLKSPTGVTYEKKNVLKTPPTLPTHPCEIDQSLFNGRENVSYEECTMRVLESSFSNDTLRGGRWFPRDCKPQQRIAIIVPYRDRDKHFKLLLNNLIPKLRRQMIDYTFYVVEQASAGTRFNRGMIRNIGFLEAKKEAKYDCYIFNDVDTIIENDLNFYTCVPNSAYHIAVRIAKNKYRHLYKQLIGGIVSFTEKFFLKTNGYPNFFFIWGGEDDAMYERVMAAGGTVKRPEYAISHTTTIKHDRDPRFNERYLLLKENSRFWKKDGINTIEYQKIVTEKRKLYTWIYVNINETKYIEMMKSYNAEWNRLHPITTTPIPTQTMTKISTDGTK